MRRPALVLLAALLFAAPAGAAEVQKSGSQVFSGRFMAGAHIAGGQIRFDGNSVGGYKFHLDFAGRLKETDKLSLWLGGGFGYTLGTYGLGIGHHDIQLWVLVRLTFEKLVKIPLVPYVEAGVGGDALVYNVTSGNLSGGAFAFRVGGGVHYWLFKFLALGVETHVALGPGFYPVAISGGCPSGNCLGFWGNLDIVFGARFAF